VDLIFNGRGRRLWRRDLQFRCVKVLGDLLRAKRMKTKPEDEGVRLH
jgi:hypothetical protein